MNNEDNFDDLEKFSKSIRERITQLRIEKNVSEYQMSLDLGQNRTYIQNISLGRSLPSMSAFFKICKYFEITPVEFFEYDLNYPGNYKKIRDEIGKLSKEDLKLISMIIERFPKQ